MKLLAGLFLPGLSLVLLSGCCRGRSEVHPANLGSAASNKTNYATTPPAAKPGANVTTVSPNATLSTVAPAVPSNTTASVTTKAVTTTPTKTTSNATITTTAKTNTTKTPPTSPKSANVTVVTPKTSPAANSTAAAATAKIPGNLSRSSGFDVGSFVGGIVLTLGLLVVGYIGCRTYHAKRGVQYRTIDEHDAII